MKNRALTLLNQVSAVCLASAVLFSSSIFVLAGTKSMAAEIVVAGLNGNTEKVSVLLNGEPVLSGRTFYSTGVVSTTETGTATINLGKLGRVMVLPGSKLNLNFAENNISGELIEGKIEVFNTEGVSVNIKSLNDVVTNDAAQVGSMAVDVRSGATQAFASSGKAFVNNAPAQQKDDDDDDDDGGAFWLPIIFAGAVGTAVVLVIMNNNEDDGDLSPVSPVR